MKIDEVVEHQTSNKNNIEVDNVSSTNFDKMLLYGKVTKDNSNVDNSDYFTTFTLNTVVRSQAGIFFVMHQNIRSFRKFFDEFYSFASELSRPADVIVLSETWLILCQHLS